MGITKDVQKIRDANRVVRVVTLPVREVVSAAEPAKVLSAFEPAWRLSTSLANWCQRELALHDPGLRTPDAAKLAKYDPKCLPGGRGLYQHVTAACPFRGSFDGAAGSMSAVIKAVEDAWRRHPRFGRFAVLWKGEARPAVFRFPYPWPVRSQELRVHRDDAGRAGATLSMPGGRVVVRLADGPDFRRQTKQFDVLLADPSRVKQAKVTMRSVAGKPVGADLRLVGSFDAAEAKSGGLACVVRTDPAALLVAEVEGRRPWIVNADDVRRVHVTHKCFLQRVGEDTKYEKRVPGRRRAGIAAGVAKRCDKHRLRMDTALHQLSAQLVGYCVRAGVGTVVYDDAVTAYMPDGFPWSSLKERVRYKLAGSGIEVLSADKATALA